MDISSPYLVVGAIIIVFAASIWWATSSKEDGHPEDQHGHSH